MYVENSISLVKYRIRRACELLSEYFKENDVWNYQTIC